MDTTEYLDVFIDESTEHLDVLSRELLKLEKNPSENGLIEEIFRAAHTLKGMSATMGFQDLANLTHHLENVLESIRNDDIQIGADMMDVLFAALDALNIMIEDIAVGGDGENDVTGVVNQLQAVSTMKMETMNEQTNEKSQSSVVFTDLDEFEQSILDESEEQGFTQYEINVQLEKNCLLKGARVFMVFEALGTLGEVVKSQPTVSELEEEHFDDSFGVLFISTYEEKDIASSILKISDIDSVDVHKFGRTEILSKESRNDSNTNQTPDKNGTTDKNVLNKTIRVNIDRLDALMNLFEELIIDRGRLEQISSELEHPGLTETVDKIGRTTSDLQDMILTIRMVPIDSVFNRFPRMIRQLASKLGKEITIDIIGADTELDRTVIDEIADPLVHLIRNAVDHGIELPEERIKHHKAKEGTLKLTAYHGGNNVFIEISDDGSGINKEKIIEKAIKNNIITSDHADSMTDEQVYGLIMASGFSTSETVSDVSGRGVGLDVVRYKIESLGGSISIDSTFGKGSVFSIQLPLTLSIVSVLLVELSEEKYAIPLSTIVETIIVHKRDVVNAHHKKVIDFREKVVPLIFLHELFQVPGEEQMKGDYISIVIVQKGNKMTGLVVDSFIGQQEVVLKSLGGYLTDVFAISGATILGDGEVALIIDSTAFIE